LYFDNSNALIHPLRLGESDAVIMSQKHSSDKITKELALFIVPIAAAYLFITFYEAGFASYFGLPYDLISINFTRVMLANRFALSVAVIAFLWIGLYYNILPSTNSPFFKGMITLILVLALSLGITFGSSDAKNQSKFLVLKAQNEQVVLKIYDDKIITAPFNRKKQTIQKAFFIHKVGIDSNHLYKLETVGPLMPQ